MSDRDSIAASLTRQPYSGVPNSLMGFRKSGQNTSFDQQNWTHTQPVRVTFAPSEGSPGDTFEDAVKGLNQSHALERARRNWPGAQITPIGGSS